MAHYEGVNESSLLNAIISCKNLIDKQNVVSSIVEEAKALPIDGAGASDNIVSAAESIVSTTNTLKSKLEAAHGIALDIAEYKSIKKELDQAKAKLHKATSLKNSYYKKYHACEDKSSKLAYAYHSSYNKYKKQANTLKSNVSSLETQLEQLKSKLSAAGYPPT